MISDCALIDKLIFIKSKGYNPYENQAAEAELINYSRRGCLIIYLWANDNVVFIGKNQNAYSEVNLDALKSDGGLLARRFTGGGAVYHDKGNINFTFISHKSQYDKNNNFKIVIDAMRSLGLDATLSGRNDMLIGDKKFSGNAFYEGKGAGLHHGTVLINTEARKLAKYLSVATEKLVAKGVKSVSSRVVNLQELNSEITASRAAEAIFSAAKRAYPTASVEVMDFSMLDGNRMKELIAHFSDEKYLLGDDINYKHAFKKRFEWGTCDVRFSAKGSVIKNLKIYSDALDTTLSMRQEEALVGADLSVYTGEFADIAEAIYQKIRTTC